MKIYYGLLLLLFLGLPIYPQISLAQTIVGGPITTDTTWDSTGNDYIVTSDLVLLPGVTLTINEGVVIKFNDARMFYVRGSLIVNGTQDKPVIFTSSSPGPFPGIWQTIYIQDVQGGNAMINFCEFRYAYKAISIECCHGTGPITIAYSTFANNIVGIEGYAGSLRARIDSSIFENNSYGVTRADMDIYDSYFYNNTYGASDGPESPPTSSAERMNFYNCEFEGNSEVALQVDDAQVIHCNIHNNNIGIQPRFGRNATVQGSSIKNNNIGIVLGSYDNCCDSTIHNNDIAFNTVYNLMNLANINVHVENNWWGTTESSEIDAKIYDVFDDASVGEAIYRPYLTKPISFELTVTVTGNGLVTSDPIGISCNNDCSELYDPGTLVTLTANPQEDFDFIGWSGDCSGKKLTCEITVDQPRNVSAKFTSPFQWPMFIPAIIGNAK